MNEAPDFQAAQGDALPQFANIRDGFGGGLFPLVLQSFFFGQGFECAGDNLFRRVVTDRSEGERRRVPHRGNRESHARACFSLATALPIQAHVTGCEYRSL